MTVEHDPATDAGIEEAPEDLTDFDVDFDQADPGSASENFSRLRGSRDQWKARAKAAEQAAVRGSLLEAGFLPDSGYGKALARAIASGEVEPNPGAIAEFAGSEFGWQPEVSLYSGREAAVIEGSRMLGDVQSSSRSDDSNPGDAVINEIAEARAEGNWDRAASLEREFLAKGRRR
ncbi:MAG: hypothetical protein PVG83_01160 [Acidimicrobiia bacterium]